MGVCSDLMMLVCVVAEHFTKKVTSVLVRKWDGACR